MAAYGEPAGGGGATALTSPNAAITSASAPSSASALALAASGSEGASAPSGYIDSSFAKMSSDSYTSSPRSSAGASRALTKTAGTLEVGTSFG